MARVILFVLMLFFMDKSPGFASASAGGDEESHLGRKAFSLSPIFLGEEGAKPLENDNEEKPSGVIVKGYVESGMLYIDLDETFQPSWFNYIVRRIGYRQPHVLDIYRVRAILMVVAQLPICIGDMNDSWMVGWEELDLLMAPFDEQSHLVHIDQEILNGLKVKYPMVTDISLLSDTFGVQLSPVFETSALVTAYLTFHASKVS